MYRNVYKELNVLPVKKMYLKITSIYLKKTTSGRYFDIIGTKLCNKIVNTMYNKPTWNLLISLFKKTFCKVFGIFWWINNVIDNTEYNTVLIYFNQIKII